MVSWCGLPRMRSTRIVSGLLPLHRGSLLVWVTSPSPRPAISFESCGECLVGQQLFPTPSSPITDPYFVTERWLIGLGRDWSVISRNKLCHVTRRERVGLCERVMYGGKLYSTTSILGLFHHSGRPGRITSYHKKKLFLFLLTFSCWIIYCM